MVDKANKWNGVVHEEWYEAHITFHGAQAPFVERLADRLQGWKYSHIHNDEIMGPGRWCYLTRSGPDVAELMGLMSYVRDNKCQERWVRCKIERIIFDQRKEQT